MMALRASETGSLKVRLKVEPARMCNRFPGAF